MSAISANRRFTGLLLIAVLVPIASKAALGSLQTVLSSDITVPAVLPQILGYLSELLAVACAFAGFSCIAHTCLQRGKSLYRWVPLLIGGGILLCGITGIITNLILWGNAAGSPASLLYSALNIAFELLRMLLVVLCCRRIGKLARASGDSRIDEAPEFFSLAVPSSRCAAAITLLTAASLILVHIPETVSLLMTYGSPQNSSELVYLIFPYAAALIYSLIGYLLAVVFLGFTLRKNN